MFKHTILVAAAVAGLVLALAGTAQAQTTLINDDFESGTLESWIVTAGGAGLYTYSGSGTNYATSGTYALDVKKNSKVTLTNPLPLDILDFTSITISFNHKWVNGGSTRRLHTNYAADGTTFVSIGSVTNSTSSKTYTLSEATYTFTDTAKFQFSFYDTGGADMHAYVDDIVISGTPTFDGYYWDVDGTTPGAGGDAPAGTWSAASENWNPEFDGTGTTAAWAPAGTAYFAAGTAATGTYTVTVDGTQDIGGLYFGAGTVTLANGTDGVLKMTSDNTMRVGAGKTATVETPISDDGGAGRQLIKDGAGTLILSGDNTYTGLTTVSAGKVILSGNNVAATGGMALNAGVTEFQSAASVNGIGRSVTVGNGVVAAADFAIDNAFLTQLSHFGGCNPAGGVENAVFHPKVFTTKRPGRPPVGPRRPSVRSVARPGCAAEAGPEATGPVSPGASPARPPARYSAAV